MKPQVYYEHMYKKQRKLVQKDRQDRRVKKERQREMGNTSVASSCLSLMLNTSSSLNIV